MSLSAAIKTFAANAREWLAVNWWRLSFVLFGATAVATYAGATASRESRAERAYIAGRRGDCYSILARERDKFTNVEDGWYNGSSDRCGVRYKEDRPRPECAGILAQPAPSPPFDLVDEYLLTRRHDCETQTLTREY